ncbi:hypothetical protein [Desulfotruncus alcoholivorax]|uniref:hypothetical protein n=1 Tax=Desulfotruncus alcoholivorax TaxID=265477 RepID=UPI0003FB06C1|nr:hypothetical protein [Desulfotruncus alcoholivorax]
MSDDVNVKDANTKGVAHVEHHHDPGPDFDPNHHDPKHRFDVVCIETYKVYDFCYQSLHLENNCFTPSSTPPPGSVIDCMIVHTDCEEVGRTEPDEHGRANVTFAITVKIKIKIHHDSFERHHHDPHEFSFFKTVSLCAPEGTRTFCEVVNSSCGPCIVTNGQICCAINLCIVISSVAPVKLLVPTFGFCTPTECEAVSPIDPFVCPGKLFPDPCRNHCHKPR